MPFYVINIHFAYSTAKAGVFYSLLVLATTKRVDVQQDRDENGSAGKIFMTLVR